MLRLLGLHQENVDLDCVRQGQVTSSSMGLMVDGRPISWESKHHGCLSPHKNGLTTVFWGKEPDCTAGGFGG